MDKLAINKDKSRVDSRFAKSHTRGVRMYSSYGGEKVGNLFSVGILCYHQQPQKSRYKCCSIRTRFE